MWSEGEHLQQVVFEIEHRAAIDAMLVLPVGGGDLPLEANPPFDIFDANLPQLAEHQLSEAGGFAGPVDVGRLVGHGDQHIEGAVPRGGEGGVGDAGVLHIDRRIGRQHAVLGDFLQVPLVVASHVNGVVPHLVFQAFNSQVQHVGGTRVAGPLQLAVVPPPAEMIGHQGPHRVREVGVHDEGSRGVAPAACPHRHCPPPFELDLFHRFVEVQPDPQRLGQAGHLLHHRGTTPQRVVDPVLVLHERQDGVQAGAAPGRHPQVLRLERKGDGQPRVAKVRLHLAGDRMPGTDVGERPQGFARQQVGVREEGALENRAEPRELRPVVGQEPLESAAVLGRQGRHLLFHQVHVGGAVQLSPGTEFQAILRIDPHHRDFPPQVAPDRRVNLGQHPGIHEEGGPGVEAESFGFDGGGPPAHPGTAFEQSHGQTGPSQQQRGGQSSGTGSHDNNFLTPGHARLRQAVEAAAGNHPVSPGRRPEGLSPRATAGL